LKLIIHLLSVPRLRISGAVLLLPPRRYPYFDVVVGLARQVKGDNPDKKGYPGPPGWGFGVGLTTPHSKKHIVTKVE
jgi:hypothetical protein